MWEHYGLTPSEAEAAGMNSKMFNAFLDGTKSALEMAAMSNATGLSAASQGLAFPPAGIDDLAHVLPPRAEGGQLEVSGQLKVVSSVERDGRPVFRDLRWGVYVVLEAPTEYAAACFCQYGMNTDESGRYSAMYKPFHLIGLELNISILFAALLNTPTGRTRGFMPTWWRWPSVTSAPVRGWMARAVIPFGVNYCPREYRWRWVRFQLAWRIM